MKLTLYYTPMSSSSRVHWALEELGVPYEKVRVSLKDGEQRKTDFLKLNPNGKVPVLVVDGTPIFESLAMLLFLGETFGVDKGLYPPPGVDRALCYQWMMWAGVTFNEGVMRLMRNTSERFPAQLRSEVVAQSAREDLTKMLGILDQALRGKAYLVTDNFTFADLALSSWVSFATYLGLDAKPFGNVQAWLSRCSGRLALERVNAEK